jgi:hypothetical protein
MKSYVKRIFSSIMVLVVAFACNVGAFAAESASYAQDDVSAIRNILNAVNKEYGTDFYIPAPNEVSALNSAIRKGEVISETGIKNANLSRSDLIQIEKELREAAAFLTTKQPKEESVTPESFSVGPLVRAPKSSTRSVTGASIYFEGWANDNNGYWAWEYLNTTTVTPKYNDPKYMFVNDGKPQYSHSFFDSRRTCAVSYYGTMHVKTGAFWIPENYTHYQEWWAGM